MHRERVNNGTGVGVRGNLSLSVTVTLSLGPLLFSWFRLGPNPPPPHQHSINQALICSFFQEMEVHWWQEKYLGISVLNFTFLQLF